MSETETQATAPERERDPRVGGAYVIDEASGERRLVEQTKPRAPVVPAAPVAPAEEAAASGSEEPEGQPGRRSRTKE